MAQVSKYNLALLRWASRVTKVIVTDIQLQSVCGGDSGGIQGKKNPLFGVLRVPEPLFYQAAAEQIRENTADLSYQA